MGTIIYDPNKKNNDKKTAQENKAGVISVEEVKDRAQEGTAKSEERYNMLIENIDSVRPMGDTDCDYVIYLEDYVYTYIYQYANTDLSCEHSAAIVGEYYPDSREMIICGIMPIDKDKLLASDEWVNEEAIEALQEEKEKYFQGARILGWLHMQPGYGTMLTMKEVKAHREVFDKEGTLLLLVDPINKIETFYVYEDDTLKEQSGYYMYYDKNPCMQQYMLDRPFISTEKEEVADDVVNQFREIGKMRKKEYEQKRKMNLTVVAASIALLALSAVILKVNDQNGIIKDLQTELAQMSSKDTVPTNQGALVEGEDASAQFVFSNPEAAIDASTPEVEIVDHTKTEAGEDKEVAPPKEVVPEDTALVDEPAEENADATTQEDEIAVDETAALEPAQPEEIADSETVPSDTTKEDADYITYVVEEGDSLRKISFDHYQTELRTKEIIALNDLENGDHIYVGQKLKLPAE